MAHGRTGPDLVMNTRYVGASAIRAVSEHERRRTPDGSSDIDLARSHMNTWSFTGPLRSKRRLISSWPQAWARSQRRPSPPMSR